MVMKDCELERIVCLWKSGAPFRRVTGEIRIWRRLSRRCLPRTWHVRRHRLGRASIQSRGDASEKKSVTRRGRRCWSSTGRPFGLSAWWYYSWSRRKAAMARQNYV